MKCDYILHMGTDLSVVNAARVSFDKTSEGVIKWGDMDSFGYVSLERVPTEADSKLISFLARHDHWTPFAHTAISLRMQAPIPIRTQCFKHKQGLVENEESRRYVSGRPQLFVPESLRSKPEGSIKQGSGDVHPDSGMWLEHYKAYCSSLIDLYEDMVADGVCPEQVRFVLPQGVEVSWVWTGNLFAFANFYKKRTDSHAQKEIQDLAKMVGDVIEPLFPVSWKALTNG